MTETERERCREVGSYLFFGVLTTIVNYVSYYALTRWLGMGVTAATAWAWALAVLFAFVTNKLWVFRSRTRGLAALFRPARRGHDVAVRRKAGLAGHVGENRRQRVRHGAQLRFQ